MGWLCWDWVAIPGLSSALLSPTIIPSMSQLLTVLGCREEPAGNAGVPLWHSWLRLPLILERDRLDAPEVPLERCRMPFVVLIDAWAGRVVLPLYCQK